MEADKDLMENAIHPLALGRKNYLFARSHEVAQRATVIYSLLGTCQLHGVNPWQWLADVIRRLLTHRAKRVTKRLPYHWKQSQKGRS